MKDIDLVIALFRLLDGIFILRVSYVYPTIILRVSYVLGRC